MTAKAKDGPISALSGQHGGALEVTMGMHNESKSVGVRY